MQSAPKKPVLLIFQFFCFSVFLFLSPFVYAATPTVGTISPYSGTTLPNTAKTFTCTYSDTDGWANLKEVHLLISSSSTALANAAYLYYDQNANLLYLRDDANTAWLGGYGPGSANTIENTQVKLDCASTTVSCSVNTLSLSFNLTFKQGFSGKTYNTYLKAIDDSNGASAITKKGTYTINNPPQLGTISPSSGTGTHNTAVSFTTTFTDLDGWVNIQYGYLLINSSTSGINCFYGYYNQNSNKLYLRNDANTAWLEGYAPGSANTIENSYGKLDCAQTTISGTDNTLSITWSVSFKAPFTGAKNTYLYVRDDANSYNGWVQAGESFYVYRKPVMPVE